jgi:hypothetical protein
MAFGHEKKSPEAAPMRIRRRQHHKEGRLGPATAGPVRLREEILNRRRCDALMLHGSLVGHPRGLRSLEAWS